MVTVVHLLTPKTFTELPKRVQRVQEALSKGTIRRAYLKALPGKQGLAFVDSLRRECRGSSVVVRILRSTTGYMLVQLANVPAKQFSADGPRAA